MSLSNSNALLTYTALSLLEEACGRAGVPPEAISGEVVYKALDQLNLMWTSWLNKGIQLWKRQQLILPLYVNTNQVPLPGGYNLVTTLNRRTLSRQLGVASFSDSGGTAANAFDDNFATSCTQTSSNGSIGQQFSTALGITTVGLLSAASGSFALFVEWSNDGITYTPVDAFSVVFTAAGQWVWADIVGGPMNGATFWRVRSVGTTPLAVEEIFFGNTPLEINLGPWNLDEYANMPNKAQGGPVVNWYQQRNKDSAILYVWPTPDITARYDTLMVWATLYLDQVSSITQSLDFPPRWYEAVTASLARRLCRSLKEADLKRYDMLLNEEALAMSEAQAEERDPAPTNYDLGVDAYTR